MLSAFRFEPIEDIVNARINFANGCVANMTASRVSPERCVRFGFSVGVILLVIFFGYRQQKGYVYRMAREDERIKCFQKTFSPPRLFFSNYHFE
jgi:hypothetical protein